MREFILACILAFQCGCVSAPVFKLTNHQPGARCSDVDPTPGCTPGRVDPNRDWFNKSSLESLFKTERPKRENHSAPQLGLALGGGGNKSAAYSIGVLAALGDPRSEIGLNDVDAISSVSGGSYASLWLFSRINERIQQGDIGYNQPVPVTDFFRDCLPFKYAELHESSPLTVCPRGLANFELKNQCCENEYCSLSTHCAAWEDSYRYQNHLRGYQSLFSNDFHYQPTSRISQADIAVQQSMLYVPSLFVNAASGLLFDWSFEASPIARRYFRGIDRTYARTPADLGLARTNGEFSEEFLDCETETCRSRFEAHGRPVTNDVVQGGITMPLLKMHHQSHDIPLWIVNTTARVSRGMDFAFGRRPNLEDSVFEFTPYHFGSGYFGYFPGAVDADLSELTGASAAFLDSEQRLFASKLRPISLAAFDILNLNWGYKLENPRLPQSRRLLRYWLPFPLYFLYHGGSHQSSAFIYLSDGGQSENTGLWSLIRRGFPSMILSDNGEDANGQFKDLCLLRQRLMHRGLSLMMIDLENFELVCMGKMRYDLQAFPLRYTRGCITSDPTDSKCTDSKATYFARLVVLKPAIDMNRLSEAVRCPENEKTCKCAQRLKTLQESGPIYENFPAELFGFIHENLAGPFPQHSTLRITLESSPFLFGAYRELAHWQASAALRAMQSPTGFPKADGARVQPISVHVDTRKTIRGSVCSL